MSIPISVVVCTRNRVDSLRRCVEALASIQTDYDWEVIIVDNGSSDGTSAFLSSLPRQIAKARLTTILEPKRGLAVARNTGVRQTSGNIIAFTDDDCYVAENYIDAMISAFENPEIGFVGGRVLLYDPSDLKITIEEREDYFRLEPRTFVAAGTIHGANMAFRRAVLDRIGQFDEKFGAGTSFGAGEDMDAVAASLWEGIAGAYDPRPVVYHHHGRKSQHDVRDLLKNYDRSGGAYFAKYILRSDSRSKYARSWLGSVKRGVARGDRIRNVQRSFRELCGGLRYVGAVIMDRLAVR